VTPGNLALGEGASELGPHRLLRVGLRGACACDHEETNPTKAHGYSELPHLCPSFENYGQRSGAVKQLAIAKVAPMPPSSQVTNCSERLSVLP
jgi:hypothetical protein